MVAALVQGSGVVAGEAEAQGNGAGVLFVDVVGGGPEMAEVVKVVAWGGLTVGVGRPGVPTGVAEPNTKVWTVSTSIVKRLVTKVADEKTCGSMTDVVISGESISAVKVTVMPGLAPGPIRV